MNFFDDSLDIIKIAKEKNDEKRGKILSLLILKVVWEKALLVV